MICTIYTIYVINLILLPLATQSSSDLSDVDSTPLGEYPLTVYDARVANFASRSLAGNVECNLR